MGEAKRKEELIAAATEEMKRWGDRKVALEVDVPTLIGMCGAMQLALRHRGFAQRPTAGAVREVVFKIKEGVFQDWPALQRLVELGFHQRFDEPGPEEKQGTD